MNFRQIQYAVWLSEVGSFSQLAEKLKITQPALSKQILVLEKELGVQLFDRSSSPLALTAAGEHFVKNGKELLYNEAQLVRSMEQFRLGDRGRVVIGTTPFRSAYLIPGIVKKLREEFPNIQIRLIEEANEPLRRDAADGCFDFAILNLPADETLLDLTPIEADRLAIVIHDDLVERFPEVKGKNKVPFKECASIPFAVLGAGQEMRVLFDKFCITADMHPDIAVEVVSLTTAWEMACSGVAATMLPLQFIKSKSEVSNHKLTIIELEGDAYLRQPAVAVKKGQYLSKYAEFAKKLLTKEN